MINIIIHFMFKCLQLEQMRQENLELTEKNTELTQITSTMELERTHVLKPTLQELESQETATTELQTKLAEEKENVKKLNTINSQIKEENQKYKLGLEKYDVKLRKNEENSQNLVNSLTIQLQQLQADNEELNKKLLQCELDLLSMRQRPNIDDEEKVDSQHTKALLGHVQNDTIEITGLYDNDNPVNVHPVSSGSDGDIDPDEHAMNYPKSDEMQPLIVNNMSDRSAQYSNYTPMGVGTPANALTPLQLPRYCFVFMSVSVSISETEMDDVFCVFCGIGHIRGFQGEKHRLHYH